MKFLQQAPFFRLFIPIAVGIMLYQWLKLPLWGLGGIIGTSLIFIVVSLIQKKTLLQYEFRWLFGCGIFLFFFSLSYFFCDKREKRDGFQHLNKHGIFGIELTGTPMEKANSYLCEVNVLQFSDSVLTTSSYGKAYLYLQKDSLVPTLLYGDYLLLETEFTPPETMRNPDGFDYAAYLKRQGVGATAYVSSGNWMKSGRNEKISILLLANKFRNYLLDVYRKYGITGKEFAVLSALTLGYREEIDPDLQKSYTASGAVHILAVSGLHVGIIYAVLSLLFSFLNKSTKLRIIKTIIILLLLWCYAFLAGLSPSVLRATLMFSFAALGSVSSRKPLTYNTIFMSAFLLLLINPNLLFSISFQLSYSAVLSIIYFRRKISGLFLIRNKLLKWFWDLITVSVAAQLGTLPFVLFYFQSFPNYFLLTNIIAIPAVTFVLYLAFALLAFSFLPFIPAIIAYSLKWILKLLNFSVEFIEKLPYSVSVIGINHVQIIMLFAIIFLAAYYFYSKNYFVLISILSTILIFFTVNVQIKYNTLQSQKLIVYESYRGTHVNILDGNRNYIYTDNEDELYNIASGFWNNKKILPPERVEKYNLFEDGFFIFNSKRILILQEDYGQKHISPQPLQVDYLIIGNKLKPRINRLLECIEPKMIVCDKTIAIWYANQIEKICSERNIGFYSVRSHGAFIADIAIK